MKTKLFYSLLVFFLASTIPLSVFADPLDNIAKEISKASGKLKNKQIAVLPFPYHDGKEGKESTVISERLLTKIASRGKLQVIERSLLEKVMSELKLEYSGAISQESAKKLGNVLGVEAILTGTLIDLGDNQVEINARLINAESGLVLMAASDKETKLSDEPQREVQSSPSTIGQTPANDSGKKADMSVFFNSNSKEYSRFSNPDSEPAETPQRKPPQQGVVFSNRGSKMVSGFGAGDETLEPPADFFGNQADPEENPNLMELQNAYESEGGEKGRIYAGLRDRFHQMRKPKMAALAQLYFAESLIQKGNYEEAINQARPVSKLDQFPKLEAHALFLMARASESMGRIDIARNLYREIIQNHPFQNRLIGAAGRRMRQFSRRP